jgi:hypothetical protein
MPKLLSAKQQRRTNLRWHISHIQSYSAKPISLFPFGGTRQAVPPYAGYIAQHIHVIHQQALFTLSEIDGEEIGATRHIRAPILHRSSFPLSIEPTFMNRHS